jgi:hypothetical protein
VAVDSSLLAEALRHLVGPGMSIADARGDVPRRPGLYAVHGAAEVWHELGLGEPPDGRPLYLGKAEGSLASRDVDTHFSTGKTGSSTLRRSLAGLLAEQLALEGRPRNPAKPERFANFGLEASGDGRLTSWMVSRLRLAVWPAPDSVILDLVETAALVELLPPLNVAKVSTPWRPLVQAGRRRLATQAEAWATGLGGAN